MSLITRGGGVKFYPYRKNKEGGGVYIEKGGGGGGTGNCVCSSFLFYP